MLSTVDPRRAAGAGAVALASLAAAAPAAAHGISESARQRMLEGGLGQYVVLGAEHMLTGYDHLLFLLGVIFFLKSARAVVTLVTAFTLGHSLTLTAATFLGITANYYLIDAVIALSVVYKGFDNSDGFRRYLDVSAPSLVTVVFLFGLVHGFGLSTRLQQLPLGEPGLAMLARIVAFNVGVEAGQIVALVAMVAVLGAWR
ncbi:MAG TPA: HupE/UreJ family protein, partial [Terriglobales bacterium]|nr:HupE/UreJ family protein [Terriglobales bacterium]